MPHILVIEDDLEFRQPLIKMLMIDGHTVAVANDGVEALNLQSMYFCRDAPRESCIRHRRVSITDHSEASSTPSCSCSCGT